MTKAGSQTWPATLDGANSELLEVGVNLLIPADLKKHPATVSCAFELQAASLALQKVQSSGVFRYHWYLLKMNSLYFI